MARQRRLRVRIAAVWLRLAFAVIANSRAERPRAALRYCDRAARRDAANCRAMAASATATAHRAIRNRVRRGHHGEMRNACRPAAAGAAKATNDSVFRRAAAMCRAPFADVVSPGAMRAALSAMTARWLSFRRETDRTGARGIRPNSPARAQRRVWRARSASLPPVRGVPEQAMHARLRRRRVARVLRSDVASAAARSLRPASCADSSAWFPRRDRRL